MESQQLFFRIDYEGRWYGPDGKEVNEASIYFLTNNIRSDENGYFVGMGFGPAKLIVEDVPFVIQTVQRKDGDPPFLELVLTDGVTEALDPETLSIKKGEVDLYYCMVRGGQFPARFSDEAARVLEQYLTREEDSVFLTL
ncbi:MAG: hypothetical protein JW885_15275 [Deltaproteobacteria bacterium]|nr:hypothetical protein [Candidatus Zymogenaceae bacterium]